MNPSDLSSQRPRTNPWSSTQQAYSSAASTQGAAFPQDVYYQSTYPRPVGSEPFPNPVHGLVRPTGAEPAANPAYAYNGVDAVDARGYSAVMTAAESGDVATVERLAQLGANLNRQLPNGMTAIYLATGGGHAQVISALTARGANADLACTDGFAPLHHAAETGRLDCVRALLDGGANVNVIKHDSDRPNRGWTPLYKAVSGGIGNQAVIELLLRRGANPNIPLSDDFTPLYEAAQGGTAMEPVVQLLLQAGADPNQVLTDGFGPLHVACANNAHGMVSMLLRHNANPHQVTRQGALPASLGDAQTQSLFSTI